ncbi:hypothetical protein BASA81_008010 [Batrachochytrium salamandrivorans]|nr:hypothetical protein BASA81_008010 [Batrachochytrium salamandrivorans]
MASSQISRLKAQLEAKTKAVAQGDGAGGGGGENNDLIHHHFQKARTQQERERIQIETARKLAARYNLTHRALAMSSAKKTAEHRLNDMNAAKEAKERAAKYQMTARSLQMSSTGTSSGRVNVLSFAGDEGDDGASSRYSHAYTLEDDGDNLSQYTGEYSPVFTSLSAMEGGGEDSGKGGDFVDAIRAFLLEHDPDRAQEAETLAFQHQGREDELLSELHQQYPEYHSVHM